MISLVDLPVTRAARVQACVPPTCARRLAGVLVLALALGAPPLGAEEPGSGQAAGSPAPPPAAPSTVLPFFLGEVVVAGEDEKEPPPGTADTLEADAIEAAGVVTVGEALELLPGVSLSVGARNEQKVWVRGYEQSNVLLLVDGVPVADPYSGDVDLGLLPIFDVARITVTRGGASPLFGPNGLGGVISVVTLQGGASRRLAGELRLTDNRTVLAHASTSGGSGPVSWYLGLGTESSDGWSLSDDFQPSPYEDGGRRVNSDLERSSALARIGWRPDDASTVYASVRWVDAEKGIPFHTERPAGFVRFARFPEWRQTTLALGYERSLGGGAALRGQLYGHRFDNTLEMFTDSDLESVELESTFADRVYGGYLIGEWRPAERHRLGASLHLRQDSHSAAERSPGGPEVPTARYLAWTSSLALEDRWRIGRTTGLVGSLAVERLEVADAQSLRRLDGGGGLVDDPLPSDTLLSPQLEVRSDLGERWSVSASVYRRARFPTLRQLYGTDPPNPTLGPQRTTGLDVGVAWRAPSGLGVRANLFADRVDDLISRQGRDQPYRNQDQAEIRGLEVRVEGRAGRLDYSASWTALDPRFTRSSEGLEEIPYVPRNQVALLGVFNLGRRVDLRALWLATGERVYYDRGVARELAMYSLLDLGIAGRLGGAELSLQVDNLLDADAEQEAGFPLPGRRLWIGARFALEP